MLPRIITGDDDEDDVAGVVVVVAVAVAAADASVASVVVDAADMGSAKIGRAMLPDLDEEDDDDDDDDDELHAAPTSTRLMLDEERLSKPKHASIIISLAVIAIFLVIFVYLQQSRFESFKRYGYSRTVNDNEKKTKKGKKSSCEATTTSKHE
jgi:hypothetical protein